MSNDYVPTDALDPQWSLDRVHNWHNYISDTVKGMWATFTEEQRKALAAQAEYDASEEEWD